MKNYTCNDYIKLYLDRGHWSHEIRKYNIHLTNVLSRAFGINLDFLVKEKYKFLENIITIKKQLKHPLSGALEIGSVLEDFPELKEILNSVDKQHQLLLEIVKKIVENQHHEEFNKVIDHNELEKYGYEKGLEPDYGKIYEDY